MLHNRPALSLDTLLVLALAPAHIGSQSGFIVVLATLLYLLVSLAQPLPVLRAEITASRATRLAFVGRYALILIMAAGAVVVPTLVNVLERSITPVEEDGFNPANLDLSDSALQLELAVDLLLRGSNPYVEPYHDTPMRFYQWQDISEPGWSDPALDYFAYLPGNLLLSLPVYFLAELGGVFYDQRLVFLLFYALLLLILPHLAEKTATSLALVVAVGLNPLVSGPVTLGMNDVTALLALVLVVLSLSRAWTVRAALFMGLALVLKQTTWFALPLYALHVWDGAPSTGRRRYVLRSLAIAGGVAAAIILPFFLWDPGAFYTDTIAYPAGRVENLYPIRGFTIGRLLMGAGVIPSFFAPFPFALLQLLFGLPALALLLRFQHRNGGVGAMAVSIAVLTFVVGFFSRFFHYNYLGAIIALATVGILLIGEGREELQGTEPSAE